MTTSRITVTNNDGVTVFDGSITEYIRYERDILKHRLDSLESRIKNLERGDWLDYDESN